MFFQKCIFQNRLSFSGTASWRISFLEHLNGFAFWVESKAYLIQLIHLLLQPTSNEVSMNRFLFAWLVKKPTWRNPRHFLETKSKRSTIIIRFALKLRWVFLNKIERESIKVNCWLFHLSFLGEKMLWNVFQDQKNRKNCQFKKFLVAVYQYSKRCQLKAKKLRTCFSFIFRSIIWQTRCIQTRWTILRSFQN
jgi:hypothetical protein